MIEDRRGRLRRSRFPAGRGVPYQAGRSGGDGGLFNAGG